jgi:hypothetical protein
MMTRMIRTIRRGESLELSDGPDSESRVVARLVFFRRRGQRDEFLIELDERILIVHRASPDPSA